jgi:hypothetical protein
MPSANSGARNNRPRRSVDQLRRRRGNRQIALGIPSVVGSVAYTAGLQYISH